VQIKPPPTHAWLRLGARIAETRGALQQARLAEWRLVKRTPTRAHTPAVALPVASTNGLTHPPRKPLTRASNDAIVNRACAA